MVSRFEKYLGTDLAPELVAIIPPSAPLSTGSTVDPKHRGKVPGSYNPATGMWSGRRDFLEGFATDAVIREWSQYPDPNVGIRAKYFPGVDFDIDVEWLVKDFLPIAERHLGASPVRGRDGSPRVLLMYRLAEGAAPIRTFCLKFTLPETADTQHAIEILGNGRSFVLEGRHSSGGQYLWRDDIGPVDYGSETLTPITTEALRDFVAAVKDTLDGIGATIISGQSAVVSSAADGNNRRQIGDSALIASNVDTLRKAIQLIPCNEICDRGEWLRMLVAAKAGCGADERFYEEVILPWCLRYEKNTKDYVRKTWDSISDAELGADYIYRVAREYDPSFSDDIQELFSASPEDAGDQTAAPASIPPSPAPNPGEYRGPVPKLMPIDFALHKLPRREYVLGYRFMAGTVSLGIGPPGAGKSMFSILSALSIATGRSLTDEPVHRSSRVWIHNNEDSLDELYRRIGGVLRHHGIDFNAVRENIFVTSGLDEPLLVAVKEKDLVKRTAAVAQVIASVREMGIIHIAIDPLVSTHRGVSENANEEIEQVAETIRHIAHETDCSIDLIHHSLKPQSRNSEAHAGDMNAARGASALIGAVRIVYTVSIMNEKTANNMKLPRAQAVRMFRLDHGKGNYSARDPSIRWFELVTVPIGNGPALFDGLVTGGDTVAVPVRWNPTVVDDGGDQDNPKSAAKEVERQNLRDLLASVMQADRCKLSELLGVVEREFGVGKSTARKRVTQAIPTDGEVPAQVNGTSYLLRIEKEKPSPPGKSFVVRKPADPIGESEARGGRDRIAA